MANIIDFILGIALRLPHQRVASRPHESGCAAENDPSPLFESLALPQQWNTGADLADAYQSACAGST